MARGTRDITERHLVRAQMLDMLAKRWRCRTRMVSVPARLVEPPASLWRSSAARWSAICSAAGANNVDGWHRWPVGGACRTRGPNECDCFNPTSCLPVRPLCHLSTSHTSLLSSTRAPAFPRHRPASPAPVRCAPLSLGRPCRPPPSSRPIQRTSCEQRGSAAAEQRSEQTSKRRDDNVHGGS